MGPKLDTKSDRVAWPSAPLSPSEMVICSPNGCCAPKAKSWLKNAAVSLLGPPIRVSLPKPPSQAVITTAAIQHVITLVADEGVVPGCPGHVLDADQGVGGHLNRQWRSRRLGDELEFLPRSRGAV